MLRTPEPPSMASPASAVEEDAPSSAPGHPIGSLFLKKFNGFGVWKGEIKSFDGERYRVYYPDDGFEEVVDIAGMNRIMAHSARLRKKKVKVATRSTDMIFYDEHGVPSGLDGDDAKPPLVKLKVGPETCPTPTLPHGSSGKPAEHSEDCKPPSKKAKTRSTPTDASPSIVRVGTDAQKPIGTMKPKVYAHRYHRGFKFKSFGNSRGHNHYYRCSHDRSAECHMKLKVDRETGDVNVYSSSGEVAEHTNECRRKNGIALPTTAPDASESAVTPKEKLRLHRETGEVLLYTFNGEPVEHTEECRLRNKKDKPPPQPPPMAKIYAGKSLGTNKSKGGVRYHEGFKFYAQLGDRYRCCHSSSLKCPVKLKLDRETGALIAYVTGGGPVEHTDECQNKNRVMSHQPATLNVEEATAASDGEDDTQNRVGSDLSDISSSHEALPERETSCERNVAPNEKETKELEGEDPPLENEMIKREKGGSSPIPSKTSVFSIGDCARQGQKLTPKRASAVSRALRGWETRRRRKAEALNKHETKKLDQEVPSSRKEAPENKLGHVCELPYCFTYGEHVWVIVGKAMHHAVIESITKKDEDVDMKAMVKWASTNGVDEVKVSNLRPMFEEVGGKFVPSSFSRRERKITSRYVPPRPPGRLLKNAGVQDARIAKETQCVKEEEVASDFVRRNLASLAHVPSGVAPGPGWKSKKSAMLDESASDSDAELNVDPLDEDEDMTLAELRRLLQGSSRSKPPLTKSCTEEKTKQPNELFDQSANVTEESGAESEMESDYKLLWDYYLKPTTREKEEIPSGMILRRREAPCKLLRFKDSIFRQKIHRKILRLNQFGRKDEIHRLLKALYDHDKSMQSGDGPYELMDEIFGKQSAHAEVELLDSTAVAELLNRSGGTNTSSTGNDIGSDKRPQKPTDQEQQAGEQSIVGQDCSIVADTATRTDSLTEGMILCKKEDAEQKNTKNMGNMSSKKADSSASNTHSKHQSIINLCDDDEIEELDSFHEAVQDPSLGQSDSHNFLRRKHEGICEGAMKDGFTADSMWQSNERCITATEKKMQNFQGGNDTGKNRHQLVYLCVDGCIDVELNSKSHSKKPTDQSFLYENETKGASTDGSIASSTNSGSFSSGSKCHQQSQQSCISIGANQTYANYSNAKAKPSDMHEARTRGATHSSTMFRENVIDLCEGDGLDQTDTSELDGSLTHDQQADKSVLSEWVCGEGTTDCYIESSVVCPNSTPNVNGAADRRENNDATKFDNALRGNQIDLINYSVHQKSEIIDLSQDEELDPTSEGEVIVIE